MPESKKPEIPIEILPSELSEQALAGIIESFILREGTDYGAVEVSYEKKIQQIRHQMEKGLIKIVFDQASESVTLLSEKDFNMLMSNAT